MTLERQILYVLELKTDSQIYSKIGETQQNLNKRISGFGFGSKFQGMEKDVRPVIKMETLLAPSLERLVKKLLQKKKYKKLQLKDRNLGRGYTEWYIMESSTMVALVRNAFKQLYKDDPYLSQKLGELKKQMGEI